MNHDGVVMEENPYEAPHSQPEPSAKEPLQPDVSGWRYVAPLRFIIPGVLLAVIGGGMMLSDESRSIGWRFAVGGLGFAGLGVYLWPRGRRDGASADPPAYFPGTTLGTPFWSKDDFFLTLLSNGITTKSQACLTGG